MRYDINDIYDDVRNAIDEIALNDADFIGSQDNSEMQDIISAKVEEAADYVHLNADIARMACDEVEELSYGSEHVGGAILSDDMVLTIPLTYQPQEGTPYSHNPLRLISAMAIEVTEGTVAQYAWPWPVTEFIHETSPYYAAVRDKYTGANADKPAVVITNTAANIVSSPAIEVWKMPTESASFSCRFINHAKLETEGNETAPAVSIDKNLAKAFIYQVAALTLATYAENDKASTLFQLANREAGITPQQ